MNTYEKITQDIEGNVLKRELVKVPVGVEPADYFCKGLQIVWTLLEN